MWIKYNIHACNSLHYGLINLEGISSIAIKEKFSQEYDSFMLEIFNMNQQIVLSFEFLDEEYVHTIIDAFKNAFEGHDTTIDDIGYIKPILPSTILRGSRCANK